METTTTPQTNTGKSSFVPLPIDKLQVGHVGLYVPDEDEADTISCDLELGLAGGKTLIACEKGIKAEVAKLAKEPNHLPNSETGVWVHYLTQGLMRDFKRTWNKTPTCLLPKVKTDAEKAYSRGKRVLSKKDKNELIAKLTYQFYEEAVNRGEITMDDAFASMKEAAERKKELENAGYFIPSKKTQGVSLFDWEGAILKSHDNDREALKIYTRNQVVITIPDVITNFFTSTANHPKKVIEDMKKASFYQTLEVGNYIMGEGRDKVELDLPSIKSFNDAVGFLTDKIKGLETELKDYNILGVHIAKITQSGAMKPRWVCLDCVSKKDKSQVLILIGKEGERLTLRQ